MNRRFVLCAAIVVSFLTTGCSRFFIKKDSYDGVKRAALVQYAVNPHMLMGTVNSDDAHMRTADANVKTFVEKASGKPYVMVPLDELKANAGYQGAPTMDGFFTATGMKFVTDERGTERAELTPDQAKKLCADLGVDAVAIVYDSWGMQSQAMGFRAAAMSTAFVNMYDKNGDRVWGDIVTSTSNESMALAMGVIATDVDTVVKAWNEAFGMSLDEMNKHLSGK